MESGSSGGDGHIRRMERRNVNNCFTARPHPQIMAKQEIEKLTIKFIDSCPQSTIKIPYRFSASSLNELNRAREFCLEFGLKKIFFEFVDKMASHYGITSKSLIARMNSKRSRLEANGAPFVRRHKVQVQPEEHRHRRVINCNRADLPTEQSIGFHLDVDADVEQGNQHEDILDSCPTPVPKPSPESCPTPVPKPSPESCPTPVPIPSPPSVRCSSSAVPELTAKKHVQEMVDRKESGYLHLELFRPVYADDKSAMKTAHKYVHMVAMNSNIEMDDFKKFMISLAKVSHPSEILTVEAELMDRVQQQSLEEDITDRRLASTFPKMQLVEEIIID